MKHQRRVIRVIVAALCLTTASPAWASAPHATSLAQIALQSGDLPAGFQTVRNGYLDSGHVAQSSHSTVANLKRLGWVGAYESVFKQPGAALSVQNVIDRFASANVAHTAYLQMAKNYAAAFRAYHPHYVSAAGLGQNATQIEYTQRIKNAQVTVNSIAFLQGSYIALVNLAGSPGTLKQVSASHIIQRLRARMQRGG